MSGYPCDKPCEQWISKGRLLSIARPVTSSHNSLICNLDNAMGNSGSPVWTHMTVDRQETLVFVGIWVTSNSAVAITKTVWNHPSKIG